MNVKKIVEMSIPELLKRTDLALGIEKYTDFVVYDKDGLVSDCPVKDMDEDVLNRKVERWYVEPDPQDVDALIVRIYV